MVYLDDIVAFRVNFMMVQENLKAVFLSLRAANHKLKLKKCELFQWRLEYQGHELSGEGIKPSVGKVAGLHDWKVPCLVLEMRTILRFTSYYRCFIDRFSRMAVPLKKTLGIGLLNC